MKAKKVISVGLVSILLFCGCGSGATPQEAPTLGLIFSEPALTAAPIADVQALPEPSSANISEQMKVEAPESIDRYFSGFSEAAYGPDSLEKLLERTLQDSDYEWDVYAEALTDDLHVHYRINLDEDASVISASLIKLFIMGTVYQWIEEGTIEESDVEAQLRYMITISDNASANELTTLLGGGDSEAGMQIVNEWAESIGCKGVEYNRLMLVDNGLQNYVTAEACALLLRQIYEESCVSPRASRQMLALLKDQQINNRIPQGLPKGTECAHKTGDLTGLCFGDVGIVLLPDNAYILCVICNHPTDGATAIHDIVRVSEAVYEYFSERQLNRDSAKLSEIAFVHMEMIILALGRRGLL